MVVAVSPEPAAGNAAAAADNAAAHLLSFDRLHASTACKAHPVGYRDIPRGPFILHMAETFSSAHIAGAAGSTLIAGAACSTLIAGGSVHFRTAGLRAEPEQHLLSRVVTPPEDQRSPSADQGFPQRTSGTSYEPVCANPNPAVACTSAPPVLAAFLQPLLPPCGRCRPSCGLRRLCAALVAFLRASPPLCSPRCLRAAVAAPRAAFGAFMRSFHLTSTHWPWPSVSCRGRFSRPSFQDAGRSFSPACTFVKMQTGGGLLWRIV